MRKIKPEYIVIHCSDSDYGCARVIDGWHRDNGWDCIGYHYVIANGRPAPDAKDRYLDGFVEVGRYCYPNAGQVDQGAHCKGMNSRSIGVCLIGKNEFTPAQFARLINLVRNLQQQYDIPVGRVVGHYETQSGHDQGKTCPNIAMDLIRNKLLM